MRVVCAGHVNWDVTLFVDRPPTPETETRIRRRSRSVGGSAANVAVGLCGLSVSSGLVGSVGDDEHASLAREALAAAGVDLEGLWGTDGETAVKYIVVPDDADVIVLGTAGANEALTPDIVDDDYVRRADHLHLTGQRPATAAHLAGVAAVADMTVSFDPGRRVAERDYGDVYPHLDLLFVNEHEAGATGALPDDLARVRKRGADGATYEGDRGHLDHQGHGVQPVDTSGAGDAFAAGFLASWLDDAPPEEALAVANACGAVAAQRGGAMVQLDWPTVASVRRSGPSGASNG